jgi:trimethylamine--corrinoid protein Co-methyltransferase
LEVTRAQLLLCDKIPFIFSRGHKQVADNFELIRLAHGITPEEFRSRPYTYTIINTNSPLQLDIPMADGIIDFATAGQVLIITPFTLAGAMAPVTVAGALTLAHAEALAGLTLAQIVRPGAPIVYGSFTSNVDMKSGSPAFSVCHGAHPTRQRRTFPMRKRPTNRR